MSKKEKNQSNPIFIIIVFLIIIIIFLALPYIKGIKKDIPFTPNKTEANPLTKVDNKEEALSDYIKVGDNTTITFNNFKISNPVYSNNALVLTIYSEKEINLSDLDYYVEFYKEKSKFLFRRSLSGIISGEEEITINDINIDKDVYIAISHIAASAIPKTNFPTDESGISGFKCSRADTKYEYDFQDKKLIRVSKRYNYKTNNLDEFSNKLFDIQKEANKLNNQAGITASVVESNKEFIYIIEINYLESANQKIDKFFFNKDELENIVYFKMNAEGFECYDES